MKRNNMFYEILITIMKKNIWIWILAAIFVAACSSDKDEPTIQKTVTEDDWEGPDGRVVIQLGGGDYTAKASASVTRAPLNGLYNTETSKATTQLGIFALATWDSENNIEITGANRGTAWGDNANSGILLNNVKAEVTAWPKGDKPKGIANENVEKITLYNTEGNAPGTVYYYPMQKKYDYTFYGYAPYQTNQSVTATNSIINFDNFNGSQDIIWQKATATKISTNSIWTETGTKNSNELTGYKAQYIRQLKYHEELNEAAASDQKLANYPWIPNLQFTHKLAQLRFSIIAANNQSAEDKEAAKQLKVKEIAIKNHGTQATLDILTGELKFQSSGISANDTLAMMDASTDDKGTITFNDTSSPNTEKDVLYDPAYYLTGDEYKAPPVIGYLMVNPQESYDLYVTIVAKTENSTPQFQRVHIVLNAPEPAKDLDTAEKKFYAGRYYNVRIGVYAMQQVEVTATLDDWKSGGADINAPVE